ncbi:MAG: SGNH/GDSL hydrolase family protein [Nocardiopsaceae bacterium]|nr:SGNH/GDSL hydrolase family protein [Nocardiopsaceae bacterium]
MRIPEISRRTLIPGIAGLLVLLCIAVLAIPTTRSGVLDAWCDLTGSGCGAAPGRHEESGSSGWRTQLSPVEAAIWGNYVALGDSYSSGHGADDYAPGTTGEGGCRRSANAYPEKIAAAYDFAGELGFFACSSQKGNAMLEDLGSADSQLDRVSTHSSLVTLGIGGNDLGFTSILRTCMMRLPVVESHVCVDQEPDIEQRMGVFESTFEDLIAEIRVRAPDARILVLGYPRLFPAEPTGMYYTLTVTDQQWLNRMTKRFNEQIKEAAAEADAEIVDDRQVGSVEYIDVYNSLEGHEVGTEEPWLNGVLLADLTGGITIDRSTFHPNALGQSAFGDRVSDQIDDGPERPLYAARETLENASPEVLASEID